MHYQMVNTTIIYPDVGTLNEYSMRTRRNSSVIWGPRLDDKCVEWVLCVSESVWVVHPHVCLDRNCPSVRLRPFAR